MSSTELSQELEPVVIQANRLSGLRKIAGRIGLVVSLSTGLGTITATTHEVYDSNNYPVYAAEESYPWADAAHIPKPPATDNITWGYQNKTDCDGKSASFDCSTTKLGTNWYFRDQWGYDLRNCTSYVAWRAAKEFGASTNGWGHAKFWGDKAHAAGYSVDQMPEAGDIAVWTGGDYGHVAFVEELRNDGMVRISEYNQMMDGNFQASRWVRADKYIDINGTGKGLGGQATSPAPASAPESKKLIPGDFNGDGVTDPAIYRPQEGGWHVRGIGAFSWGAEGDIPVPADYNGDKTTDIAVYRPREGGWHIRGIGAFAFGHSTDIPVPGDYNGDGDAEIAVWRPTTGNWHIREVGDFQWGRPGDIPVPGYYNGDDVMDIAIYRPENGGWYIRGVGDFPYGHSTDIPVPADYSGDGITDPAIYRPSDGGWRVRGFGDFPHGWSTDVPVPGRYNNDAYADAAIYRPSDGGWRIRGVGDFPHGTSTDIPAIQTLNAALLKRYGLIHYY